MDELARIECETGGMEENRRNYITENDRTGEWTGLSLRQTLLVLTLAAKTDGPPVFGIFLPTALRPIALRCSSF